MGLLPHPHDVSPSLHVMLFGGFCDRGILQGSPGLRGAPKGGEIIWVES